MSKDKTWAAELDDEQEEMVPMSEVARLVAEEMAKLQSLVQPQQEEVKAEKKKVQPPTNGVRMPQNIPSATPSATLTRSKMDSVRSGAFTIDPSRPVNAVGGVHAKP